MGCHTWIYKKASALSDKEKSDICSYREDYYIKHWWGKDKSYEEILSRVRKMYEQTPNGFENCGTPEEFAEKMIQEYKSDVELYEKDPWEYFIKKHKDDYPTYFEHNGEQYANIDFDEPFRVYGYPSETFSNCDELIEWLKNHDDTIGYYNKKGELIEGFSPVLEKRIRKYFKKHGEDNLLVDFG